MPITNSVDRRVERTRLALIHALRDLCSEQRYERVTVQMIAERANVGRTTFYEHFDDKEDLLEASIENLFEDFQTSFADARDRVVPAYGTFTHVENHRAMASAFDLSFISEKFREKVAEVASKQLRDQGLSEHRTNVAAQILAGSLVSLLLWWLRDDAEIPAQEMAEQYYSMFTVAASHLEHR